MTQEEKARAYDEALERARKIHSEIVNNELLGFPRQIEDIFPQLRESEDERIRKELINFLRSPFIKENLTDKKVAPWIAYLEKQKEQKPVEKLAEEDYVKKFKALCDSYEIKLPNREYDIYGLCKDLHKLFGDIQKSAWSEEEYGKLFDIEHYLDGTLQLSPDRKIACIDFLKSLRPQPKQEWSEEDEKMIKFTLQLLDYHKFTDPNAISCKEWLKSLRNRQKSSDNWKPSEEQMKMLAMFTNLRCASRREANTLESLYNDLKKLM